MPIFKRHIKVPPGRLLCHTNVDNKKKQVFENFLFNCVTRLDLSGVHLRIRNGERRSQLKKNAKDFNT